MPVIVLALGFEPYSGMWEGWLKRGGRWGWNLFDCTALLWCSKRQSRTSRIKIFSRLDTFCNFHFTFDDWRSKVVLKALVTRAISTHNITIKRYYDNLIIFSHRFLLAKVSSFEKSSARYIEFFKSLPWLALKSVAKNYQIIVISFYRNIVILGVEIARVTRA